MGFNGDERAWRRYKGLYRTFEFAHGEVIAYLPAIYFILRTSDGLEEVVRSFTGTLGGRRASAKRLQFMLQNFGFWLILAGGSLRSRFIYKSKRRQLMNELAIYSWLVRDFLLQRHARAPWSMGQHQESSFSRTLGIARLAWVALDHKTS